MNTRSQLTLFVSHTASEPLEAYRRVLDPIQAGIIAAHVTLCREDEIAQLTSCEIENRVSSWKSRSLRLNFGPPETFAGHGVLLPCVGGMDEFQALRCWVLDTPKVRPHKAEMPNRCLQVLASLMSRHGVCPRRRCN